MQQGQPNKLTPAPPSPIAGVQQKIKIGTQSLCFVACQDLWQIFDPVKYGIQLLPN